MLNFQIVTRAPGPPPAVLVKAPDAREPKWQFLRQLVVDSVSSPCSKRAYGAAVDHFLRFYYRDGAPGFSKATVLRYRSHLEALGLSSSSVNIRLTALRKLAVEAADNGLMDPTLAAGIARVKGAKRLGVRTGNWLTREQAEELIQAPDTATLKGRRDRALLAILIGCGLRRSEAAALTREHVRLRDARWILVDLVGKGQRVRSVPMPSWAKQAIDQWTEAAGIVEGRIFRPVNKGDRLCGASMSAKSICDTVGWYGRAIGVEIAPHDLRRTFAKLAHRGKAALEQIQLSLGHSSIQTTERYLGVRQDLQDAPCDHLQLRIGA